MKYNKYKSKNIILFKPETSDKIINKESIRIGNGYIKKKISINLLIYSVYNKSFMVSLY